jgi:hypothetical protein
MNHVALLLVKMSTQSGIGGGGGSSLKPLNHVKTMDEIQEAKLRTWLLPTSDNLYNLEEYL